jgi:hypothetical protein
MRIIHISKQRYEFIVSLGYNLSLRVLDDLGDTTSEKAFTDGDSVYHLLDDETAMRDDCLCTCTSIDANTPAELEVVKTCGGSIDKEWRHLRDHRQAGVLVMRTMAADLDERRRGITPTMPPPTPTGELRARAAQIVESRIGNEWEGSKVELIDVIEAALLGERERCAGIAEYRRDAHLARISKLKKNNRSATIQLFEANGRWDEARILAERVRGRSYEELTSDSKKVSRERK